MQARLRGPNNLLFLRQIINGPDFHCSADEIAEPRPDLNIQVTAFTESKMIYYSSQNDKMVLTDSSSVSVLDQLANAT